MWLWLREILRPAEVRTLRELFVLDDLRKNGEVSGRELQLVLRVRGLPINGPRFYALMAELENRDLIKARLRRICIEDHHIWRSTFCLRGPGWSALREHNSA